MPWHLWNVRIGLWFALFHRAVYLSVNYRQHWLCGRSVLKMWLALAADPSLHSLSPSNSLLWLICSMTADICHHPSRPACLKQNPARWGTATWRCCAQSGTHHHCGTRRSPAGHGVWKQLWRHVLLTCLLVPQACRMRRERRDLCLVARDWFNIKQITFSRVGTERERERQRMSWSVQKGS